MSRAMGKRQAVWTYENTKYDYDESKRKYPSHRGKHADKSRSVKIHYPTFLKWVLAP